MRTGLSYGLLCSMLLDPRPKQARKSIWVSAAGIGAGRLKPRRNQWRFVELKTLSSNAPRLRIHCEGVTDPQLAGHRFAHQIFKDDRNSRIGRPAATLIHIETRNSL